MSRYVSNTEFAALRSEVSDLTAAVQALVAQGSSAATTTKVAEPKARAARTTRTAPKAQAKVTLLRQSTRKAFIAAALKEGVDYTGFSTKDIAASVVAGLGTVPAGFEVGAGYRALFA